LQYVALSSRRSNPGWPPPGTPAQSASCRGSPPCLEDFELLSFFFHEASSSIRSFPPPLDSARTPLSVYINSAFVIDPFPLFPPSAGLLSNNAVRVLPVFEAPGKWHNHRLMTQPVQVRTSPKTLPSALPRDPLASNSTPCINCLRKLSDHFLAPHLEPSNAGAVAEAEGERANGHVNVESKRPTLHQSNLGIWDLSSSPSCTTDVFTITVKLPQEPFEARIEVSFIMSRPSATCVDCIPYRSRPRSRSRTSASP
jgi:hypothetical protein